MATSGEFGGKSRSAVIAASCGDGEVGKSPASGTGPEIGFPATLILNPNSGKGAAVDADELQAMLEDAGYQPKYLATERAEDLDQALAQAEGLLVVAGGDGTLREVVKRQLDRPNPIALLPLGTANNSARSLGIEGPVKQLVARLRRPRPLKVDVAKVRGPWGEEVMLEGAGLGVFANVLAAYKPAEGKSLLRAVGAAVHALDEQNAVRCRIEIDEESLEGEYLLVEAMNMHAVGPRLALAPGADPTDGLLDIVLVRYDNHDAFIAYLRRLVTQALPDLSSVEVRQGRKLKVNWRDSAFHVDGVSLCTEARETGSKGYSAQIEVLPEALELWLPAPEVS